MAELEKVYPDIHKRLSVRPGITGLAQIRRGYDTTVEAVKHKLEADLRYIANRKWSTELRIMVATLTKLNDKGAR
jgi:lipopolysaccharide/colanic/teichoic acid biosynthesis glycosyltransferase